ncbi:hypothetical protein Tco_1044784 [Tanacetum coccineum]|uniref:Uncharacterized protein n=1 Tax=Tanacetum coccineum TaxID=301880 RepID=A0ABQ5GRZ6_9ASTR
MMNPTLADWLRMDDTCWQWPTGRDQASNGRGTYLSGYVDPSSCNYNPNKVLISASINAEKVEKVEKFVKENIGSVVKEQQDATAPQQIQEFLANYMQTNTITINPSSQSTIPNLKQQLYAEMYANPQARAEDPELFEVLKK